MANATVLNSLRVQASYERDGFQRAVADVSRWAGQLAEFADNLVLSKTAVAAKADIVTNAGVKPYILHVNSPSGATTTSYLQVFNTSSGSVTLGTTIPELSLRIEAGASRTLVLYDSGDAALFPTAMSWAVTAAANGQTAANAANTPTITLLYR